MLQVWHLARPDPWATGWFWMLRAQGDGGGCRWLRAGSVQAPHAAHPRGPLLAHHPCPPGLPQLEGQRGDAGRGGQLFHAVPAADGRYRPAPSPWGPLLSSLPQNEGKELITEPLQGLSQTRAACLCVALGPGSAATFQPARSQWVLASAPPFFLVPTSLGVQAQGPGRSRRLPASLRAASFPSRRG